MSTESGVPTSFRIISAVAMVVMIPSIAAFLVWYSRSAKQKGGIS